MLIIQFQTRILARRPHFATNCGHKDAEAEARVKAIFNEVGVDERYAQCEQEADTRINGLIDAVPEVWPVRNRCGEALLRRAVFRVFYEKFNKRTK